MNSVSVMGIGTAVPPHGIDQVSAAHFASLLAAHDAEQARRVAVLYRRSGVRNRHLALLDGAPKVGDEPRQRQTLFEPVDPGDPASRLGPGTARRMGHYEQRAAPLAAEAVTSALAAAGVPPGAITHLVTISCTGFAAPGVDIALIQGLGLDAGVSRANIGFMGCQGALNGLRVATALARTDPRARVLLCAVELCGLHLQYTDETDGIVANSLFADGAAAAVISTGGSDSTWRLAASGAAVLPDSLDAMTWAIGDHGFTMTLSPRVPSLIEEHLRPWTEAWLGRHGLSLADVGSWAIHPGGTRIVSAVEAALGLDQSAGTVAREILAEHGNMSSPTVLFVLKRLMERDARRPCVALAFGPGLSVEAALLT